MRKQLRSFILWVKWVLVRVFFSLIICLNSNTELLSQKSNGQTEADIVDEIKKEIGEGGNTIDVKGVIGKLGDRLKDTAKGMLTEALGISSPIAEVASLREVITESFTKQNKIALGMLKIEEENNKSYLTISKELADYYAALKLSDKLKSLNNQAKNSKIELNKLKYLTAEMKRNFNNNSTKIADCTKIIKNIKLATNQVDEQIWMGEGQRIEILDDANRQIADKQKNQNGLFQYFKLMNKKLERKALRTKKLNDFAGVK
jgi:hypothetical protein